MKKYLENKKYIAVLFCLVTAFLLIMICSRSSFLYPVNNWDDVNCYFSMGKAMMNGQVIYRDIYEQKGPYLYFLYGLSYLVDHTGFFGVFLFEVLSMTVLLIFSYKIMRLYLKAETSLFLLPILGFCITVCRSFYWGGSAEEYCLPLLAISLYDLLKYFKEDYPDSPDWKMILRNGVIAGLIAGIKYTLLGFHFVWIVFPAFLLLIHKNWKKAISICAIFGGGMVLALLPWFIYFGINGALGSWWEVYIFNNVFLYSGLEEKRSLYKWIYDYAKILYWRIGDNGEFFYLLILGMFYSLFSRKIKIPEKLSLYLMFGIMFIGIYVKGDSSPYYCLPLSVFTVMGFVAVGQLLEMIFKKENKTTAANIGLTVAMTLSLLVSAFGVYKGSMNTFLMAYEKDDLFLYHFKEIIEQEENPTLANYGCLDVGLYTVTGIVPTTRFFQACAIALEEQYQEQYDYIAEGRTQFVVTIDTYPDVILEKYDLVAQEDYNLEVVGGTYYLFKRKE